MRLRSVSLLAGLLCGATYVDAVAASECTDLKRIVEGAAKDKIVTSSFKLAGKSCSAVEINGNKGLTCEGPQVPADEQGKSSSLKRKIADAAACLGGGWQPQDMLPHFVSLRNNESGVTIIYSVTSTTRIVETKEGPDLVATPVISITITKGRSESEEQELRSQAAANVRAPERPTEFCTELKNALNTATEGFTPILGRKTGTRWKSTVQFQGWSDCVIGELDNEGTKSRYFSCRLGPYPSQSSAEQDMLPLADHAQQCLGDVWRRTKSNSRLDGGARIGFESDAVATLQFRARKDILEETWEIVFDIDQN